MYHDDLKGDGWMDDVVVIVMMSMFDVDGR